jgi:ketosteroid isomerase-like protein
VAVQRTSTELAERGYRAWNEDDLEALLAVCHPDIEYHSSGVFPGMRAVYEGEEGVRDWWADFHEPWKEIKVIPERIAERDDQVAILVRFEGRGREGIETTMRFINTLEVRDGQVYRFGAREPTDEALRELGLD